MRNAVIWLMRLCLTGTLVLMALAYTNAISKATHGSVVGTVGTALIWLTALGGAVWVFALIRD